VCVGVAPRPVRQFGGTDLVDPPEGATAWLRSHNPRFRPASACRQDGEEVFERNSTADGGVFVTVWARMLSRGARSWGDVVLLDGMGNPRTCSGRRRVDPRPYRELAADVNGATEILPTYTGGRTLALPSVTCYSLSRDNS
jgi:hypothetical protein